MGSGEDTGSGGVGVGGVVRGAVLKALVVVGGVFLFRRLRRSTTRWDHARIVADALSGEKVGELDPSRIMHFPGHSDAAALRISLKTVFSLLLREGRLDSPNYKRSEINACLFTRICWFVVQFSREQARKDPDNFFNLR
jgi:hypothetical protein